MADKLTFKDYLKSKNQLKEAIKNTPKQTLQYKVSSYCKLVTGTTKEVKESVSLKPRQVIIVEWFYDNLENPTPINIKFLNHTIISEDATYKTYWKSEKFSQWLSKNTYQLF